MARMVPFWHRDCHSNDGLHALRSRLLWSTQVKFQRTVPGLWCTWPVSGPRNRFRDNYRRRADCFLLQEEQNDGSSIGGFVEGSEILCAAVRAGVAAERFRERHIRAGE